MFIDEEMEQIYASTGKLSDVIKTLVQKTLPDECKAEHIQHANHIWRHFASHHKELNPDGFKKYLLRLAPDYEDLINKTLSRKI